MRLAAAVVFVTMPIAVARASPNVELDDPRYEGLAIALARDYMPMENDGGTPAHLYQGGMAPLTDKRMRRLFLLAKPLPSGPWLRLDRVLIGAAIDRDRPRSYTTVVRPRQIAGDVAVTCEHRVGRPCVGSGVLGEIDGSAGYGDAISGTLRVRANAGTQGYDPTVAIDRLYIHGDHGPVAAEIGRDVLVIGPRSRTQLGWGDHAPPLDHVRVSTARPLALGTDSVRGNVLYAVARLRAPQTYPGNLLTISRVQLDIVDRLELGLLQLLQLGGEGARELGPVDFVLEHLRRADKTASATDSSNRRFGGDVAWRIPELQGARLYYQLVFEDIRAARWMDAVRYDADHLVGVEILLGERDIHELLGEHGLVFEYHTTGVRSQEHGPRMTGLTNAGRVGGSPLGPDARSIYIAGRYVGDRATYYPWIERASLASDEYSFVDFGPITLTTRGAKEFRSRAGLRVRASVRKDLWLEADTLVEKVDQLAFERDAATRWNARLAVNLVWRAPWYNEIRPL